MDKLRTILGLLLLGFSVTGHSITIVQMQTRLGTATSDIYIELFNNTAPDNVNNFLGYVTRGDYDNSFFHRKAQTSTGAPFVVQGGGFTYVPQYDFDSPRQKAFTGATALIPYGDQTTGELGVRPIGEQYYLDQNGDDVPDMDTYGNTIVRVNGGLQRIPVDTSVLPVKGEASLSNLRGTIAMALSSNLDHTVNPDSATDQWFVNLSDNTQLDPGVGNFTVFGKVLGNGMDFFDQVNNLSTYPIAASAINPEFGDLPAINYTLGTVLLDENLVKLNTAREVMTLDKTDYDFGYVPANGTPKSITFTITTSTDWSTDLVISKVGDLQTLAPPFSVTGDTCTGVPVSPGSSCTITVAFAPTSENTYQGGFDIAFSAPGIPNLPITLEATSQTSPKATFSTGNTLDFNYIYPGIPRIRTVSVTNLGQQLLTFSSINVDNTSNFSTTDNCISVAYKANCNIDITMNAATEGVKTGVLTVNTNDTASPYTISMTGTGSYTTIPTLSVQSSHDFGDLHNSTSLTQSVTVTNTGGAELDITSISLGGADASDFSTNNDCVKTIAASGTCAISVTFTPQTKGPKSAQLTITSDDPNAGNVIISLTGTSSSDYDGIPDAEENAAPNNGDNNEDGSQDSAQSNVVSIVTASGKYITMATINKMGFSGVSLVDNPSPSDTPAGTSFVDGFVTSTLGYTPGTATFQVGIILPLDQHPDAFYQYGPTPDNPTPHWYNFAFDGHTGAELFDNVTLYAPDGSSITRNFIRVWYADGQRGDNDLSATNKIVTNISGISIKPSASSSSGGVVSYALSFLFLLLIPALRAVNYKYAT